MKSKLDTLRREVSDFDALIESNAVDAAEYRAKAKSLQMNAEMIFTNESVRKTEIAEAVETAELECQEVEKLRNSIKDLTLAQEKDAADMKLQLENDKQSVSAMEAEIARSIDELALIKTQCAEHKEKVNVTHSKLHKETAGAKRTAYIVKTAYERALTNINNFKTQPDDGNLALQMKLLDESEQKILDDANRERDEIIQSE
jgi:chromosome segregation ATPase